jgi:regulator of protease activity HflC (stomatin/prohibitin superfamily)
MPHSIERHITVQSVEIRDVKLPAILEDSMSGKAQADREREAGTLKAISGRRRTAQTRSTPTTVVGWRLRPSWRSI